MPEVLLPTVTEEPAGMSGCFRVSESTSSEITLNSSKTRNTPNVNNDTPAPTKFVVDVLPQLHGTKTYTVTINYRVTDSSSW